MKVLVVTNMYPSAAEPWFGSFVKDQVDALRRLGVEADVLRFDGRRDWRAYAAAARELRGAAASGQFDLVHAHYGLTGAVALSQRRLPVVTTFHGSDSGQIAWQRVISWVVARRTSPIFVSAENARRLGLPHAPVIPAGVDTLLFHPRDRAAARMELGWGVHGTYVLLPGARANPVKRADLFDRTLAELPGVRGVSLEGYGREDVARVMNAVDAVLVTSDAEGSPVAVKEALACLTPVVSVPVGDLPALLADLPGCTIVRRDPLLLAQAVSQACTVRDPGLRRRALAFSYERVAERIKDVYATVAGRRTTHPGSAHGA
jgi:glycosyltransferase involved in cell wall biosynthesis